MKKIYLLAFLFSFIYAQTLFSQDGWKSGWTETLAKCDTVFHREQAQFRLMQSYQNEADESIILRDIDSLHALMQPVNDAVDMCNAFIFPNTNDGINASETVRLKLAGLKEYFDQCRLQIHVNNNILQKKLKNESLDFKVKQIDELTLKEYSPQIK
jgi:hypothetical protein